MSALAYAGWLSACARRAACLGRPRPPHAAIGARRRRGPRAARAAVRGAAGAARARRCERAAAIDLELRRAALALDDLVAAGRGGRARGRSQLVDVGALLDDGAEAWGRWPRRSACSLSVEPLRGRALVRADPLRLAQACGNLVANALEHGGSPVRVRGRVVAGRVRIEVSDAGPGLPAPVEPPAGSPAAAEAAGREAAASHRRPHRPRPRRPPLVAPSSRGACLVIELPSADAARRRSSRSVSTLALRPDLEARHPPDPARSELAPGSKPARLRRLRDPDLPEDPTRPPVRRPPDPPASSPRRPMTRRRRGALLIGLALALGGLAASDVGRREAAVRAQLAPLVDVVVAGRDLPPRRRLATADLALRRIPARYAPVGAASVPEEVVGRRLELRGPARRVPRRGPARGRVGARARRGCAAGSARSRSRAPGRPSSSSRARGSTSSWCPSGRRAARAVGRAGARGPPARRGGRRRRGRARRRHAAGDGDAGARAVVARGGRARGPAARPHRAEGRVPGARRLWAA